MKTHPVTVKEALGSKKNQGLVSEATDDSDNSSHHAEPESDNEYFQPTGEHSKGKFCEAQCKECPFKGSDQDLSQLRSVEDLGKPGSRYKPVYTDKLVDILVDSKPGEVLNTMNDVVYKPDIILDKRNQVLDKRDEVSDKQDEVLGKSDKSDEVSDKPDKVSDKPDEVSDKPDYEEFSCEKLFLVYFLLNLAQDLAAASKITQTLQKQERLASILNKFNDLFFEEKLNILLRDFHHVFLKYVVHDGVENIYYTEFLKLISQLLSLVATNQQKITDQVLDQAQNASNSLLVLNRKSAITHTKLFDFNSSGFTPFADDSDTSTADDSGQSAAEPECNETAITALSSSSEQEYSSASSDLNCGSDLSAAIATSSNNGSTNAPAVFSVHDAATAFEIRQSKCKPGYIPSSDVVLEERKLIKAEVCLDGTRESCSEQVEDVVSKSDVYVHDIREKDFHFKEVMLHSQKLHYAMDYCEMEYMLTTSRHLELSQYDAAFASFALGLACFEQKKLEESADYFRESEELFYKCHQAHCDTVYLNDMSLCRVYRGDIEVTKGNYKGAVEHYQATISLHQPHCPSQLGACFKLNFTLSSKLSKLALALRYDSDIVSAQRHYREAIRCPDATPADIISVHTSLGNLLHSVGSNKEAVDEYVIAIRKAEEEKDYLSLAWAHGNLGNTYLSLGKTEKGLDHLRRSLDLTFENDPNPSSISRALNNLGTAYQSLQNYSKAEKIFDEALSQAIYCEDDVGQARAYGNIGNLFMIQKVYTKAISHYSEVLRLSKDKSTVYVAYHNRGCSLFELAEERKEQKSCSLRKDYQYIVTGPDTVDMEYKHQMVEIAESILELYQQGLKDLQKVLKNVEASFSKATSSTIGLDLYLSLFHINAKSFLRAQDCAYNLKEHYIALTIAEQARARTLGELLLKRKSFQLSTPFQTPLDIEQLKKCVELLDPYTPVVVLSYTGTRLLGWVLVYDKRSVSINSFEQEPKGELFGAKSLESYLCYELAEELTGNIDLYGEEKEMESSSEESDTESVVGEEEMNELNNVTATASVKDNVSCVAVMNTKVSNNLMVDGKKGSDGSRVNNNDDDSGFQSSHYSSGDSEYPERKKDKKPLASQVKHKGRILSSLHKMIAVPVQAILKAVIPDSESCSQLVLILDNNTKMIPFPAVWNQEEDTYLGDKYTLQFYPSLLTMGIMLQTPPTVIKVPDTDKNILVVGDPDTPPFYYKGEEWAPGPLVHAKKEAQWVGHFMETHPLIGKEPTKEVIKALLPRAKLIHFATHGSANNGIVLASHRYISQSNLHSMTLRHFIEEESKVMLYTSEIESLELQPCLVVLTSCDSGRGLFKGDEIQGVARAFLLAGAQAVLTTLWKIPDQSASFFVQYFYRYLLDGHISSIALQKACISVRSCLLFSQLSHWAGFQIQGKDMSVQVEVTSRDEEVWKEIGRGCSPFPRLDLLLELEENLFTQVEKNVQILWGPCGTDANEIVIDFIAKHHSKFSSILWFNANHISDTLAIKEKNQKDEQVLVIVDCANEKCFQQIAPLVTPSVRLILILSSPYNDCQNLKKKVDTILQRGSYCFPSITPLTDLEVTQRLVYSLVCNNSNFRPHKSDQLSIDKLTALCGGSPSIVSLMEAFITADTEREDLADKLAKILKIIEIISYRDDNDDSEDDDMVLTKHNLTVWSILDSLQLSPSTILLLNVLSMFNGLPIPKPLLVMLENELISINSTNDLTSSPLQILQEINCLVPYPSTAIIVPPSSNLSDPIPLYHIPSVINETIRKRTTHSECIISIGIAVHAIEKVYRVTHILEYIPALIDGLLRSFEDVTHDFEDDEIISCYASLYGAKELYGHLINYNSKSSS